MAVYYVFLSFFIYGFLGWCAEVAFAAVKERRFVNRGFLNGPICPIYGVGVTMVILLLDPVKDSLILLYVASVVLVTVLEGLTGYAMDKIFHNKWWDYSAMPMNIGGYVCLLFSLVWGVACVAIVILIHPVIFRGMEWLPRTAGVILVVIFSITLVIDLYVTASGIIKMNRRLESMEKIASELRELSDQLGEGIYRSTITALEVQEKSRQKMDEAAQNLKEIKREFLEDTRDAVGELRQGIVENTQEAVEEISTRLRNTTKAAGEISGRLRGNTQEAAEEMKERIREKGKDAREEMEERIAALKVRYRTLERKETFVSRRLMQAFPRMESHRYPETFEELREHWKERGWKK